MTASFLFNGRHVPAFGLAGFAVGPLGIDRVDLPTPASRRLAASAAWRWARAMSSLSRRREEEGIGLVKSMAASILSNGRDVPAFGMAGGRPGALGINRVQHANGRHEVLRHIGIVEIGPVDVFIIETPGGGGWGIRAEA